MDNFVKSLLKRMLWSNICPIGKYLQQTKPSCLNETHIHPVMEFTWSPRTITVEGKKITLLDRFVFDFTRTLEKQTRYVIVSGYVAILFGRSRGTEDIDFLIPHLDRDAFKRLYNACLTGGYEFLNAEDVYGLHDMLERHMGIRVAQKGQFIPNIELKFLKDDVDTKVIRNRVAVHLGDERVHISPIEIQIAYKIFLGSEKDIEDAVYLFEIFRDYLDKKALTRWMQNFTIDGERYGIQF